MMRKGKARLAVDIGSNDGTLLRFFKQAGYKVLGIDPAKEIAKKATESGIETICSTLTNEAAKKIRQNPLINNSN